MWHLVRIAFSACVISLLSSCEREDGNARSALPSTGPVTLQDAQHMQRFLSGRTWTLVGGKPKQSWRFSQDGTFAVWSEGEGDAQLQSMFPELVPKGVTRLDGDWEATMTELRLSRRTASGDGTTSVTLPLVWLDGKLNIEIGGFQYRSAQD